jgi:hypothetical protein
MSEGLKDATDLQAADRSRRDRLDAVHRHCFGFGTVAHHPAARYGGRNQCRFLSYHSIITRRSKVVFV